MPHWPSFSTANDVVAVAFVVVLLVFGLLFMTLVVADKIQRKSRAKRGVTNSAR